jgi:hypothetical protein
MVGSIRQIRPGLTDFWSRAAGAGYVTALPKGAPPTLSPYSSHQARAGEKAASG